MGAEKQTTPLPEDQMSPKDIMKKIGNAKDAVKKNWKLIVICVVLGTVLGYVYDKYNYKPTRYLGFLTFNLEVGQQGNDMGGLSDLASAFGFSSGSSSSAAGLFVGENFLQLVKSNPMIERALMKEVTIKGKKVLLVNYYIEKSGILTEEWKKNEKFQKIRFINKPREQFTTDESIAMMGIVKKLNEETSFDRKSPKSTFLVLKSNTEDELLSKIWLETLLKTVEEFYKYTNTKKTVEVLHLAEHRADSLYSLLSRTESRLAQFTDQNQQVVAQQAQVTANRLNRSTGMLNTMYFDAVRNVESIRMSLIKETPFITIIEPPMLPLLTDAYEEGKSIKAGALIGFVLAIGIIFLRNTYLGIMNS
ncbi:MAG: hypothetical protein U0Y10_18720 [Spirosomataceae bacterium]